MSIQRVAIAGASGNLGPAILDAVRQSSLFEVTVLSRLESAHTFPPDVDVKRVDYSSHSSLTEALGGVDAVISTLSSFGVGQQKLLIDAAVAAGVRRFIPSEFGSDSRNPKVAKIPIFAPKVEVQRYLEQKAKESPYFSYTLVFPGTFLDWGLSAGLLVDVKGKLATLRDGGDVPFSASRLSTIGQAVVGILSHLDETCNRSVHIKDVDVTQKQLISIAKEIDTAGDWKIEHVNTADEEKQAYEGVAKGTVDVDVILKFLFRAVYGEGYGGKHEKDDNKLLGLKGLDEQGLKDLVRVVLRG